jgi:quercetin dioxygenase-like cupin family protein
MRNQVMVACTVAVISLIAAVGVALATPASQLTSTTIATGTLPSMNLNVKTGDWMAMLRTKGDTTLTVVENRLAPGGSFGWHSHPGPSLIIVKSGTVTFYDGDDPTCSPDVRTAGQTAFIDEGDVHIGRNEGSEDAVVVVTRFTPAGMPARIDEPAPGNCGF